jgi:hypothetical protein
MKIASGKLILSAYIEHAWCFYGFLEGRKVLVISVKIQNV